MSDDKVKSLPIPEEGAELPSSELVKTEASVTKEKTVSAEFIIPVPPAPIATPEPEAYTRTNSSKCIYFSKAEDLHSLEAVAREYPHISVSYIVQQLVKAFNKAVLENEEDHPRAIPLETTIYL